MARVEESVAHVAVAVEEEVEDHMEEVSMEMKEITVSLTLQKIFWHNVIVCC